MMNAQFALNTLNSKPITTTITTNTQSALLVEVFMFQALVRYYGGTDP